MIKEKRLSQKLDFETASFLLLNHYELPSQVNSLSISCTFTRFECYYNAQALQVSIR
jgi:hypothetical protein